ncbi:hypothetical protein QBC46DRAFT_394101 [Diplogelasinospora grovesii]|uniref:Uncharacterized protein n=1 Tax=Diplogelasinospora grovesii TaxID=303347 RepID=A0AAN6N0F7_9PEZI|nr:hypothetical protein QBC46DRAFT_394101 [Diplogelasinospora grovesii]
MNILVETASLSLPLLSWHVLAIWVAYPILGPINPGVLSIILIPHRRAMPCNPLQPTPQYISKGRSNSRGLEAETCI